MVRVNYYLFYILYYYQYCFFFTFFLFLVSPYLKMLSMVASTKLLHLLEAFSTPWFLFSSPTNHHLVFFLLEIFNNIIQYQFDGKIYLFFPSLFEYLLRNCAKMIQYDRVQLRNWKYIIFSLLFWHFYEKWFLLLFLLIGSST